jgi:hypothetical protein
MQLFMSQSHRPLPVTSLAASPMLYITTFSLHASLSLNSSYTPLSLPMAIFFRSFACYSTLSVSFSTSDSTFLMLPKFLLHDYFAFSSLFSMSFIRWFIFWAYVVQGLYAQYAMPVRLYWPSRKLNILSEMPVNISSHVPVHVLWIHSPRTVHYMEYSSS